MEIEVGKRIKYKILIDDEDYNKVKDLDISSAEGGLRVNIDGKFKHLRYYLVGADGGRNLKVFIVHKNGNNLDFRKKNLVKKTRVDVNSKADKRYLKKETRGAMLNTYWYCQKTYNNVMYSIKCDSELEALRKFDAISDFLNVKGFRNFPGERHLLSFLDKTKIKISQEKNNLRNNARRN